MSGNQTFELVSPILKGESGMSELVTVCSVLNRCGAKVNKSCGTHVHLNARDFSIEQWKRIYINYARLEKVIESKIKQAQSLQTIENLLLNSRYWKVNPQSYSRHKTCEFRQHAGTTDFVKISSWIRFLSNLVDYSEQYEVATGTLATLKNFNRNELVNYFEYRTLELAA